MRRPGEPQLIPWRFFGRSSLGRYALIGVSGVAIDFGIFAILVGIDVDPQIATLVSTPCGILNNFFWNSKINFLAKLATKRAILFSSIGCLGVIVSYHLVGFFSSLGMDPLLAKTIAVPAVATLQFIANKYITFSKFAESNS